MCVIIKPKFSNIWADEIRVTVFESSFECRVCARYLSCLLALESAAARPKLKLLPRTVKDPVNTVVHTERNASIFGTGKPRESSRKSLTDCYALLSLRLATDCLFTI